MCYNPYVIKNNFLERKGMLEETIFNSDLKEHPYLQDRINYLLKKERIKIRYICSRWILIVAERNVLERLYSLDAVFGFELVVV